MGWYTSSTEVAPLAGTVFEFGDFKLDCSRFELYRAGRSLKLERKPMELLILLAERNGDLVTRSEIAERLWDREIFVDTEHGINTAIRKIRQVLRDDPEQPRFLVTVTGKGYRFIGTLAQVSPWPRKLDGQRSPAESSNAEFDESASPSGTASIDDGSASYSELPDERNIPHSRSSSVLEIRTDLQWLKRDLGDAAALAGRDSDSGRLAVVSTAERSASRLPKWAVISAAALVVIGLGIGGWFRFAHRARPLSETDTIVLADFSNSTGDAVFDDTLKQALGISLQQSPFFNVLSDQTVAETLQLMTRPPGTPLTPDVAREVCQRAGSRAYISGSIAKIGTEYVVGLKAVNCASGDTLSQKQAQVAEKEKVLDALGSVATKLRADLGESLSSIKTFDAPLEQATTPSIEALKAFSSGMKVWGPSGPPATIPFYRHAIELDPNFALAYAWLGRMYGDLGESVQSTDNIRKAYGLRDRTSEWEKYFISANFHLVVTGNLEKAQQSCELWIQAYPRARIPHALLAVFIYRPLGQYEKSAEEWIESGRVRPEVHFVSTPLIFAYISLNRVDEAKALYERDIEHHLYSTFYPDALYEIAFLQNDAAGMTRQVALSEGKHGTENRLLGMEADTAAYSGRLKIAREFSRRAMDSANRGQETEASARYCVSSALTEALFGNTNEAVRRTTMPIADSPSRDVQFNAALALAYAGSDKRAQSMTDDLFKRFPEDTIVQSVYVPILRAKIAASRGNSSEAVEDLRAAAPYERGQGGRMYPAYVRGEAYLLAGQGSEAAAEFQKILDHRGVVLNDPMGALAHLGLARAYALEAGSAPGADADAARAKARAAYQDFFTLWKDADPNIPILIAAKSESAKLQ
jgi:DNA-binding winged helix-turn-helix (wHTH) protein/tetratricopeptide (TPR) repeat protein